MNQSLLALPAPPRVTTLLVDSSLLLVLAVGSADSRRLGRDSRLKAYSSADYELIRGYSSVFPRRVTTPHILAEVSNHLDNIDSRLLLAIRRVLKDWSPLRESWTPATSLMARVEFPALGLTDAAILQAARPKTVVLTADRNLWAALAKSRLNALHYGDIARNLSA